MPAPHYYDRPGYIYFVSDGERIKIGYSIKPSERLLTLQSASPLSLTILKTIAGSMAREMALHRQWSALRLHGEWFRATPELLAFIESIEPAVPPEPEPVEAPLTIEAVLDELNSWLRKQKDRAIRNHGQIVAYNLKILQTCCVADRERMVPHTAKNVRQLETKIAQARG